jgi:transposase
VIRPEQVWLAVEAVDMRLGIDGLSLKVQQALGRAPCDGSAYAFCNRRGNRIKLLVWDGTGVWLCVRRLHQGRFAWPQGAAVDPARNGSGWSAGWTGAAWRPGRTPNGACNALDSIVFKALLRCPQGRMRAMSAAAQPAPNERVATLPPWAQAHFESLQAELKLRELKIQQLTLELAHHKRLRFGVKSEALSPEQRDLFHETCSEDEAAIAAERAKQQPPAPALRRAKPTGRKPLPAELPRSEHRHEPASCTCTQCGRDLVKIGEDVSEQLDVEPARFFVHRHIRPPYACRACETVSAAAVAPGLIDGGLAAPGLHAWVLIQKYLDHLPLYRR